LAAQVPLFNEATGRYASSPSKDVIYFTAGNWPRGPPLPEQKNWARIDLTSKLRVVRSQASVGPRIEMTTPPSLAQNLTIYTAELWKSVDGGQTWKNLISSKNKFYFNDIDCVDETHCVLVGEGFANDGSKEPGARIYTTTDWEHFHLMHMENSTGTESFMTVQAISKSEHWVGGTAELGSPTSPAFLLHSTDGGASYANENNGIVGQAITDLEFISSTHGYATALNFKQICAVLEYNA
jgi:photosystem II stability/assembly factor-like uncharacterized protein